MYLIIARPGAMIKSERRKELKTLGSESRNILLTLTTKGGEHYEETFCRGRIIP